MFGLEVRNSSEIRPSRDPSWGGPRHATRWALVAGLTLFLSSPSHASPLPPAPPASLGALLGLVAWGNGPQATGGTNPGVGAPAPEELEFQERMASSDPEEWVRALGRLSAYFDPDKLAKNPWVAKVLRRYLIEQADEQPARTRKILSDRTMVERKEPCEEILLDLLDSQTAFLPDVTDALVAVAADPTRRQGLVQHLRSLPIPAGSVRFSRLFAIVGRHDPQAVIRVAIQRLGNGEPDSGQPKPSDASGSDASVAEDSRREADRVVLEALQRLLGIEFVDAAACREWWKQNERTPIPDWLRQRDRQRLLAETIQIWQQALQHLQPNKNALREFLLDSLDRSQEIRREGIRQTQERLPSLFQGEVALLQPFVDRLLLIAKDPSVDPGVRLQALTALENFTDFSGYEPLVSALLEWIQSPASANLRLAAVRVAGKLKCALSLELESLLESLLVSDEAGNWDWDRDADDLVAGLLDAISRIGPRRSQESTAGTPAKPGNLQLMKRVFESRVPPEATRAEKRIKVHDLVVKLLGQWRAATPPTSEDDLVLELLNQALERRAGLARRLAIIGLGTLRRAEGIAPLEVVVKGGSDPGNRSEAAKAIYTIGLRESVVSFRGLLQELQEERNRELRQQIVRHAEDLCATDPTLGLLSEYVFPKEERTPWFARLVDEPALAKLVSTDQVKPETQEVMNAWLTLRVAMARFLLERAEQASPENEAAAYQRLAQSTQEILDYRNAHPELQYRGIDKIARLRFIAGRAELVELIGRGDYSALVTVLESQLTKLSESGSPSVSADAGVRLLWVARRLEKTTLASPDSPVPEGVIDSLEQLQKRFGLDLGDEWTRIRESLRQKPAKIGEPGTG